MYVYIAKLYIQIMVHLAFINVVCQVGDQTYFPGESFKEDCNTW